MPQTSPFTCNWSDSGVGVAWVHATGGLDWATSPQLEAALDVAQAATEKVVLDLRGVTYLDSAGAHVVAEAGARALERDRRLMVVRGAPHVDRALRLVAPNGELKMFDLGARVSEMAGAGA